MFIYSSVLRDIWLFHLLAIWTVLLWIFIFKCIWNTCFQLFLGICLGIKLLDLMVTMFTLLKKPPNWYNRNYSKPLFPPNLTPWIFLPDFQCAYYLFCYSLLQAAVAYSLGFQCFWGSSFPYSLGPEHSELGKTKGSPCFCPWSQQTDTISWEQGLVSFLENQVPTLVMWTVIFKSTTVPGRGMALG